VVTAFQTHMPSNCFVLRDAQERLLACEELVVGDIVILRSGQQVPADIRLLQSNGLKIESSAITGFFLEKNKIKIILIFYFFNIFI
jgi:P-type E1-E2 ATPase